MQNKNRVDRQISFILQNWYEFGLNSIWDDLNCKTFDLNTKYFSIVKFHLILYNHVRIVVFLHNLKKGTE